MKYGGAGVAALVIAAIKSNVFFAQPGMKIDFCRVFHGFQAKPRAGILHVSDASTTYYNILDVV